MIRWQYILTRAVILAAIIVLLRYTLAPVAKYVTVSLLESGLGTRVELANVSVGLFPPTIRYRDIRIGATRNHVSLAGQSIGRSASADSIELELDSEALLHRRYVVRDGRINGLKINSDRISSKQLNLEVVDGTASSPWMTQLFGSLTSTSQEKIDSLENELEIVKRADQIRRRWKGEYAMLAKRAAELEASINQVQATSIGYGNPLRDWPRIEATMEKTKAVQTELATVRTAIDEIPAKVQADLISLQKAKQADLDRIERFTSIEITHAENFGPQLLADVVNRQVDQMRNYIDTGREFANWKLVVPTANSTRGETIDLIRGYRPPSLLIQRCEVSGDLGTGDRPFQVTGVIENFTPERQLRDVPFRARLRLEGPQQVRVDYVRDDTSTVLRESLTMHWPDVIAPIQKIGDRETIAFDVSDGRIEVWTEVNAVGDQVHGRLVSRRVGTRFGLESNPKYADTAIVSNLKNTMSGLDRLEIDATFSGTWTDMDVAISTNLTQVLKVGMEKAVATQAMVTRAELTAKLMDTYQTQVTALQSFSAGEQTQAHELLAKVDTTIEAFNEQLLRETGGPEAYLGRLRGREIK